MRTLKCALITLPLLGLVGCNPTLNGSETEIVGDIFGEERGDASMEAPVSSLDQGQDLSDRGRAAGELDAGRSRDMLISVAAATASVGAFILTFRVQLPSEYMGGSRLGIVWTAGKGLVRFS